MSDIEKRRTTRSADDSASPRAPKPARQQRDRALLVLVAVLVTAAAVIGATVLITGSTETPNNGSPGAPSTRVTTTVAPPSTTTPTTRSPSAAAMLAGFFSAADRLDGQLRTTAAAINDAAPWTSVTPRVAWLVNAADLRPVARSVPAGLPDDLRTAVILVYSDLSSRRHAMGSFASPAAMDSRTTEDLRRELGNGHSAAERFSRDVGAARSLASETLPIASVPASSRLVAEKLLLIQYVETANAGCDSRGGTVVTRPLRIVWHTDGERDGTIGGIGFTARLDSDDEWHVNLFAC